MLAFGVVFVLLLGEIDLSIAYLSGVAGVVAAELQQPDSGHHLPGIWPIVIALAVAAAIGAFQGSFVALIGVPAFVVTLAGLLAWQGVIQVGIGAGGPIIIQNRWINYTASYFFSNERGVARSRALLERRVRRRDRSASSSRSAGTASPIRYPCFVAAKLVARAGARVPRRRDLQPRPRRAARRARDHLLPALLDVRRQADDLRPPRLRGRRQRRGGAPRGHQRRAHPDHRLHDLRPDGRRRRHRARRARLSSVAPDQGGGTLLLDAISAAVIGGTSLFGGRGEVRSAVLGAAVIATIANGLFIFRFSTGVIFITTGCILLFAVTLDTLARRGRRRPAASSAVRP